jgi:hypothetical protein
MFKLILKHEIQSSPIENIERIVYWLHDQETHEIVSIWKKRFYLMWCDLLNSNTCQCCLGRQKHSNYICDDWKWQYEKVLMWNCQLGNHMID